MCLTLFTRGTATAATYADVPDAVTAAITAVREATTTATASAQQQPTAQAR